MADVSKLRANINGVFETFGVKDKIARENAETLNKALSAAQIVNSASGAIASFSDGADGLPVRSLTVDLEPIQDLHGYDYPWPAGGGKNKFNPSNLSQIYYNSAGNQLDNSHWVMSDYIAVTPGVAYTFSVDQTIYSLQIIEFDASKNWIKNNSGGNKTNRTITLDSNTAFVRCGMDQDNTTDMDISTAVETYHPQLEEGSTATAYSPYENLCPISGRESVTVTRTGKNLLNSDYSAWRVGASYIYFPIMGNNKTVMRMTFSDKDTSVDVTGCYIGFVDADYTFTNNGSPKDFRWTVSNGSITANLTNSSFYNSSFLCGALFMYPKTQKTFDKIFARWNIMVELGSAASDYEPYDGQSATVQLGQTVYGGTVEIISGQGESGFMRYVLTGNEVWHGTKSEYRYTDIPALLNVVASPPTIRVPTTGKCEFAQALSYDDVYAGRGTGFAIVNQITNVTGRLAISKSLYDIIDSLTGKAFVLPLKSPTALTLDPATLSTLKGDNNVWSDGDSVDVTYIADPKLYIDNLTEPDSDMIADTNIVSGKYFTVNNVLYLATANIANGAAIIPGTNCTKTNLAEALNALKA